jgi:hypothetical protein
MKYNLELDKEQLRMTLIMVSNVVGQLESQIENDVNPTATNVVDDYQKSISFYKNLYNTFEKQYCEGLGIEPSFYLDNKSDEELLGMLFEATKNYK